MSQHKRIFVKGMQSYLLEDLQAVVPPELLKKKTLYVEAIDD